MSTNVCAVGFHTASESLGVIDVNFEALSEYLRAQPLSRASPKTVLESERFISKAELRRLMELAGAGGAITLVNSSDVTTSTSNASIDSKTKLRARGRVAQRGSAVSSDEDPGSPTAHTLAAPVAARIAITDGSSVNVTVATVSGFALAVADYRDEITVASVPPSSAVAIALAGPNRACIIMHTDGAMTFESDAPLPAFGALDRQCNGRTSVTSSLVHFCVLKEVEITVKTGGRSLVSLTRRWNNDTINNNGDGGARIVLGAEEVNAALVGSAASSSSRTPPLLTVTVQRKWVWSLANDGHTLCVAVPCTAPPLLDSRTSATLSTRTEIVHIEPIAFDASLGGWSSIISPTHALKWQGKKLGVVEVVASAANVVIVLFAPGNAVTVWDTLRSNSVHSSPVIPVPTGLIALHAAVAARGVAAAVTHNIAAPIVSPFVESSSLPRHIAVIMDGNGRWAASQSLPRSVGHAAGVETINTLIRSCRRLRIPFLTLYAFSAQNWSRPEDEVRALMRLLSDFVETDLEELCANGVRLLVNGDLARLPHAARVGLTRMIASSAGNTDLNLCLALSYGGREEIAGAAAAACRAARAGLLDPSALSPETFRAFLPHPHVPDPDLLIRTSGELRVSNFLLWQIAYTELYVTTVLWPEFGDRELADALIAFAARERRFGKTSAQLRGGDAASVAAGASMEAAVQYGARGIAALEGEPSFFIRRLQSACVFAQNVLQNAFAHASSDGGLKWLVALTIIVLAIFWERVFAPGSARDLLRSAAEWVLISI